METTTRPAHPPAPTGRVAVPEVAELLQLRRRPAAVAAGTVVLFALVLALIAPGLVPANALVGLVVGLLAVAAGVVLAVLIDGRDPILRGPRHLRRDGHTVLGRMAGPDAALHGGEVLDALERRIDAVERLRVVLTGSGADPSELATALGRGAAARGHTSLVIDLRDGSAPGVAEVGAGDVRLGEAARLADDRPYAWISAGSDRAAGAEAAVGVAQRPPRDLRLLLIVAPEVATQVPALLETCERTIVLVPADTEQRSMVTARLDALRRAGARPEAVVVGGVAMVPPTDAAVAELAEVAEADGPSAFEDRSAPTTPIAPFAPDPPVAPEARGEVAPEARGEVAPEARGEVAPQAREGVAPEAREPTALEVDPRVESASVPLADEDDTADASDDLEDGPDDVRDGGSPTDAAVTLPPPTPRTAPSHEPEGGPTSAQAGQRGSGADAAAPRPDRDDRTPPPAPSAPSARTSVTPPLPEHTPEPASRPSPPRDDWDLRSVRPTTTPPSSDVEVGGMTASDPLTTTVALEGLLGATRRGDEA